MNLEKVKTNLAKIRLEMRSQEDHDLFQAILIAIAAVSRLQDIRLRDPVEAATRLPGETD